MRIRRRSQWNWAVGLFGIVLCGTVSACGLGPNLVPGVHSTSIPTPSSPAHSTFASFVAQGLPFESGKLDAPPAYFHCSSSANSVTFQETLGVDDVALTIQGLHSGERVGFGTAGLSRTTTGGLSARFSDSGPQLPTALRASLVSGAGGSLSVAKDGQSGRASIVLEASSGNSQQVEVSGEWSCAGKSTVGSVAHEVPAVLIGATTQPVLGVCSMPLSSTAGGAIAPLTCANGAVNALAWDDALQVDSSLLSLGSRPSTAVVASELCQPAMQATSTEEAASVYRLAQAYYGWTAPTNLSALLAAPGCVA
jgi:hypothetical protein